MSEQADAPAAERRDGRTEADARIAAVRRFNRFYTRRVGALDAGHLHSPFSLTAVRVLYELAHWGDAGDGAPTATDLVRLLGLDAGYLSRILRDFQRRGLVERTPSSRDGRQQHLRLTATGRATFADLDARACDDVAALLAPLGEEEQHRLVDALRTVETVLGAGDGGGAMPAASVAGAPAYALRSPRAGDLGWVVARHGALYAAEYGWDERFEALVARIVADFVDHFEPARERCWIAERGGENAGSIFLVRHPEREGVAKLRLLLVEPSARGLGIGRRLVDECTRFARAAGYHTITLWTNSVLVSARRIYEAAGYRLVEESPHHSFGHDLVGQTWELAL
ncbi:MAG TPA: helix-turn-helix domain-containing GNAT family N-acetyltransferase [Gemmatimonadaceae bacterium]|nr:helix-turn-helix domain-containing GNAT family N-acetyltransferase [Gemmatimonadaceae bacterium]